MWLLCDVAESLENLQRFVELSSAVKRKADAPTCVIAVRALWMVVDQELVKAFRFGETIVAFG